MTYLGNERSAVQNPILKYATEVGWVNLLSEAVELLRSGETGLLLTDTFLSQIQKINQGLVDYSKAEEIRKHLINILPRIEGNLEVWEYLRGVKTVFIEDQNRELDLRFLDTENWQNNTFHITDELRLYNGTHRIRLDVACFINGIPVLFFETKAAHKIEGIADALDQIRRYHAEGPELLVLEQIYAVTHLLKYYYGPTWNISRKSLFNWRDETANQEFESLVKTFLSPPRILRLITDYILFTKKDDVLSKVVMRPHQMRAVEKVVHRAADREKKRGLVWHTQGSGKTYTMIVAAKQIMEQPIFENPTVIMIVDRNELESQLFGNLASVGVGTIELANSKKHLQELLEGDRRGLIVTMIHKFDGINANVNTRRNIFVLVDEAHRTTGGDLGNYLMGALPNATYIGFTGTPIDKTVYGKGTFKTFGTEDQEGYLDKYSIAQSIEDKTTLPLHYTLAPNELRVEREMLEREFFALKEAEGVSDIEELNLVLEKAVNLRNMLKNRKRMGQIAEHVAKHFQEVVEPLGYKAFLVAVDREACALYKDLLDKHLPTDYSTVVISPGHNDPPLLSKYHLSEEQEKDVRKLFIKPDKLPKILIVTEKLLTGFDAPILYCMYLDKPMRDHVLLQAIARVNRPYEDEDEHAKPAGFVLDFVGIFEKLEKALAFDSADVEGVVADLNLLKDRFASMINSGRDKYLVLTTGLMGDKATESVLDHFRDEEARHAFYKFFRELEDLYEIISPDAFLRPYLDDYLLISRIYSILRAAFETVEIDRELTRKTAALVQQHTQSGVILESLDIYEINDELLKKLDRDDTPDTLKIFNLLKSIQRLINLEGNNEPYLMSIGERAEAIAAAFRERQQTTKDTLAEIEKLIDEVNQAKKERAEKSLNSESFAVYWLLKSEGYEEAESLAKDLEETFGKNPYWRSTIRQEREVRRDLYKVLLSHYNKDKGNKKLNISERHIEEISRLVDRIIRVAGRTSG